MLLSTRLLYQAHLYAPFSTTGILIVTFQLAPDTKPRSKYSLSWLARCRWNVLDLIQIVGRGSVPTYLFCDIDMSWAEGFRKRLLARGHKTTVTAILLKAIGLAQLKHPESRTALLPWGRTVTFNHIVAGFTVEKDIDGQPAVFLGAITDPDSKSVEQIAAELYEYGKASPNDVPQLEIAHRFSKMPWLFRRFILWLGLRYPGVRLRYMGATFGVTSLGKYGLKAIIPPCVCTSTFGVGKVEDRVVVCNGQAEVRPMMTMTLNFDHRIIDGAPAARFVDDVRKLLEGGLAEYVSSELTAADTLEFTPPQPVEMQS